MRFPCETVTVVKRVNAGTNQIGETIWDSVETVVAGVLVAPGDGRSIVDTNRPDGVMMAFTLYFPKSFREDLRGAKVLVRGVECSVIGEPQRWLNPPGDWDLVVNVEMVHG